MSPSQEKQAEDYWNALGVGAPYDTGIAQAWQDKYKAGEIYGPPLGKEVDSVDWSGNPIKVQMFPRGRCEWHRDTGAKWYAWPQ